MTKILRPTTCADCVHHSCSTNMPAGAITCGSALGKAAYCSGKCKFGKRQSGFNCYNNKPCKRFKKYEIKEEDLYV